MGLWEAKIHRGITTVVTLKIHPDINESNTMRPQGADVGKCPALAMK